jgi:hypothetical protein
MTAEIINLRQERKRREREARAAEAAENRVKFGRTRAEREQEALGEVRARQNLDGHLREPGPAEVSEASPEDQSDDVSAETSAPKVP